MKLDEIKFTPELRKPYRVAEVHFNLRSDIEKGLTQDLIDSGILQDYFLGRSGHSSIGLHPQIEKNADIIIEDNRLIVEARVYSLRDTRRDQLLSVLGRVVKKMGPGRMEIGRMFLAESGAALSENEVNTAISDEKLLLPDSAVVTNKDGECIIELSLEDMHYFISERTFNEENMEQVLVYGKHAMDNIKDWKKGFPKEKKLINSHFFLGAIRISIGPYVAIIEEETSQDGVSHLAARMLDGVRTTGLILPEHARQVELFKDSDEALDRRLKIRLKLYHANGNLPDISDKIINKRTLHHGVSFRDITQIKSTDPNFMNLMDSVSECHSESKPWGIILSRGKSGVIEWDQTARIQEALTVIRTTEVQSESDGRYDTGSQIPENVRELTEALKYVGGSQTHGTALASKAFPSKRLRVELFGKGIGIYVAEKLHQHPDVFDTELQGSPYSFTDDYFTGETYPDFRQAERDGVQFYKIFEETPHPTKTCETIPRQVRAFHKGFWVLPEECEKMDKVDTIIAMYGSHKDAMIPHLQGQLDNFMERMKKKLGDKLAITHGNGPGVMLAADQAAAKHDIFRLGVSIGVEKIGQDENPTPPARVGFLDEDRLTRQNLLDDISNFTLFNIGGAGTLEEIAITICSQKLRKNIITPIIFVDPFGLGENGGHIWQKLKEQIEVLAASKSIPASEAASGIENLQLLQAYAPRFCHFVEDYDEAAEILEKFIDNPIGYYKDQQIPADDFVLAFEQSQEIFEKTGFSSPHWAIEKQYTENKSTT
jgi:predicted Rossmann-fold nucleotide-binding protein